MLVRLGEDRSVCEVSLGQVMSVSSAEIRSVWEFWSGQVSSAQVGMLGSGLVNSERLAQFGLDKVRPA